MKQINKINPLLIPKTFVEQQYKTFRELIWLTFQEVDDGSKFALYNKRAGGKAQVTLPVEAGYLAQHGGVFH